VISRDGPVVCHVTTAHPARDAPIFQQGAQDPGTGRLERLPLRFFDLAAFPTVSLRLDIGCRTGSVTLVNLPTVDEGQRVRRPVPWDHREHDVIHVGTVSPPRMAFLVDVARRAAELRPELRWLFLGVSDSTIEWIRAHYHCAS
jgi:hypothetical protein